MDTQKETFNAKARYIQLFPFYRLGILLFLSLFFTAFSLSLFIAPDTAPPKNQQRKEIISKAAKGEHKESTNRTIFVDPELEKRGKRQSLHFCTSKYSHRPKIILQSVGEKRNQKFIQLYVSIVAYTKHRPRH